MPKELGAQLNKVASFFLLVSLSHKGYPSKKTSHPKFAKLTRGSCFNFPAGGLDQKTDPGLTAVLVSAPSLTGLLFQHLKIPGLAPLGLPPIQCLWFNDFLKHCLFFG